MSAVDSFSQSFSSTAQSLSRSVLGIIALFVLLVYGIASVVVAFGGLQGYDKTILVCFTAIFPFAILWIFYRIVARHFISIVDPNILGAEGYREVIQLHMSRQSMSDIGGILPLAIDTKDANLASEIGEADLKSIQAAAPDKSIEEYNSIYIIFTWTSSEMRARRKRVRDYASNKTSAEKIFSSKESASDVLEVLDFLEKSARLLTEGKASQQMFDGAVRRSFARYWPRCREWVQFVRNTQNNNTLYREFEQLAAEWAR